MKASRLSRKFTVVMPNAATIRVTPVFDDSFTLKTKDASGRTLESQTVSAGRKFCHCSPDDVAVTVP